MPDNITLLIAFAVPLVVLAVLRINAVMVFLSLCLGAVLVQFVAGEANIMLNLFSSKPAGAVSKSTLHLLLLFLPALLTSAFTIFGVHGRGRALLNVIPAAAASFLGVILAVPLLSPGLRHAIESQAVWHQIEHAQALVIGLSALISLVFLWAQHHGKAGHGKH